MLNSSWVFLFYERIIFFKYDFLFDGSLKNTNKNHRDHLVTVCFVIQQAIRRGLAEMEQNICSL